MLISLDSRTVALEVEIHQGVCNKQITLKVDGAVTSHIFLALELELGFLPLTTERVGRSNPWLRRLWVSTWLECLVVQILLVVANTPERPWRTDVEKGFV